MLLFCRGAGCALAVRWLTAQPSARSTRCITPPRPSSLTFPPLPLHSMRAGRVLNQLTGGYAVGVAGLVCFLPAAACHPFTASRIGKLQVPDVELPLPDSLQTTRF